MRPLKRRPPVRMEPAEARELVEQEGATLVDVRRRDDPGKPLEGSVRIQPDEIPERLPSFSQDVPIVLACT